MTWEGWGLLSACPQELGPGLFIGSPTYSSAYPIPPRECMSFLAMDPVGSPE